MTLNEKRILLANEIMFKLKDIKDFEIIVSANLNYHQTRLIDVFVRKIGEQKGVTFFISNNKDVENLVKYFK